MEFYGSEATILSEAKHIARHHRSTFALLYVKCLWFKHIVLWIYILLDSP